VTSAGILPINSHAIVRTMNFLKYLPLLLVFLLVSCSGPDAHPPSGDLDMPLITSQDLTNAAADAQTLEEVVNGSVSPGTVLTRLGTNLKTLARLQQEAEGQLAYATLDDADSLRAYVRPAGTTSVMLTGWNDPYDDYAGTELVYDAGSMDPDDDRFVVVGADGARWRRMVTSELYPVSTLVFRSVSGSWAVSATGAVSNATVGSKVRFSIPAPIGRSIKEIQLRMETADPTYHGQISLVLATNLADAAVIAGPVVSGDVPGQKVLVISGLDAPVATTSGSRYFLEFENIGGAAGTRNVLAAYYRLDAV